MSLGHSPELFRQGVGVSSTATTAPLHLYFFFQCGILYEQARNLPVLYFILALLCISVFQMRLNRVPKIPLRNLIDGSLLRLYNWCQCQEGSVALVQEGDRCGGALAHSGVGCLL
jgi:hypothetical protein